MGGSSIKVELYQCFINEEETGNLSCDILSASNIGRI